MLKSESFLDNSGMYLIVTLASWILIILVRRLSRKQKINNNLINFLKKADLSLPY